jgi:hypothetical protein
LLSSVTSTRKTHRGWSGRFLENLGQQDRISKIYEAYKWCGKAGCIVKGISTGLDKLDQGLDDALRTDLERLSGRSMTGEGTLINWIAAFA